ncbi:MAG: histidinol-phosphatase HisJ family protein [Lachnospiraceae bacterium]|nr:histidinol-phosphatase HisJ family protein [Lachnospiraceae bacterium]
MYTDFHIHSEFSDDSTTPMERQIESAIALGISEICFTDHVDYGIKSDWTDGEIKWRGGDGIGTSASELEPMVNVNYPEYFGKLICMKKLYEDDISGKAHAENAKSAFAPCVGNCPKTGQLQDIKIRSGLEFGVQKHTICRYENLLKKYGNELDFVLLSIHQVENKEFWNGEFMKGRSQEEVNLRYYEEMLYVASHFDGFDVLAHVDLISRYDRSGPYPFDRIKDILTDIFNVIIQKGKGIEINTSSWHYGLSDTTPSKDILRLYRSLGGKIITMGSDAHTPNYIGDHMEDAQLILKNLGFK